MASGENPTLYRRMGGYDVIAGVIDDFLNRFRSDPRFARFGTGRSEDSKHRGRQLLVDQMCALAGGPCFYTGRDMKTSHAGLAISEAEWQANMQFAAAALDTFGVAAREKEEFLDIFRKYKNEIVEKP